MSDEEAIRALLADVVFQADDGELPDYLDLFTEDAVWEIDANPGLGIPGQRCHGRSEIAVSVTERRAIGVQGPGTGAMHHLTTQRVDVDGDEATGHVYYLFTGPVDGRPAVRTIGQYHDRYRRTADGWKLAARRVVI